MSKIVMLAGSPSAPSRSTGILHLAGRLAHELGAAAVLIEVRDLPPESLLFGAESHALERAQTLVAEAQALIVATPVYKAAYSGLLKTFLDFLPDGTLRGKSAYPIATGGSNAHLLSVDYALKPVLSVLGASRILEGLYAPNDAIAMQADGSAKLRDDLDERLRFGVRELVAGLL